MEINLEKANKLLSKYVTDRYLLDHSRESASCMSELADHFGEDALKWEMAGLLHDLDWQETAEDIAQHGLLAEKYTLEAGFADIEILQAIKSHNSTHTGVKKQSKMDICLSAAENATGLIYAYILMRPEHNLDGVEVKSILKKYKNTAFAAKVDRAAIAEVETIGLTLPDFFALMIKGFNNVIDQINL